MKNTRIAPPLAIAGVAACTILGAWWTAAAVVDGDLGQVLIRLWLAVFGGFYYLVMLRVALGMSVQLKHRHTDR